LLCSLSDLPIPDSGAVSEGRWKHREMPAVLKWTGRLRAGALATGVWLRSQGMINTPLCVCCKAEPEDEENILFRCDVLGMTEWREQIGKCCEMQLFAGILPRRWMAEVGRSDETWGPGAVTCGPHQAGGLRDG